MKTLFLRFKAYKHSFALKIIALWMLCMPFMVFATPDATPSKALESFATIASLVVKLITFLAFLIMSFGGDLMTTDYILQGEAMDAIRSMWIVVRNITNIGFVLVLLFLAFSNLFSGIIGGGNWTIKEKLPKIILALILVNFSLLGFRVVIDATQVGTEALLSLSSDTLRAKGVTDLGNILEGEFDRSGNECSVAEGAQEKDCKPVYRWVNDALCEGYDSESDVATSDIRNCYFALNPNYWEKEALEERIGESESSAINIFMSFGVFFQHFERLPILASQTDSWFEVIDNTLFSVVMGLAFIIAMVALFVTLLVRMVVLWIFMVFSPFIVAAMVMGISQSQQIITKIVTYLLIPLKFAAVLSVTMVMMMVQIDYKPLDFSLHGGEQLIQLGPALSQFGSGPASILWQIATVVIFWVAVFWALKDTEADFLVQNLKRGSEQIGGYVARSATIDRPLIPTPSGKPVGLSAFGNLANIIDEVGKEKRREQTSELTQNVRGFLGVPQTDEQKAQAAGDALGDRWKSSNGNLTRAGVIDELKKIEHDLDKVFVGNTDAAEDIATGLIASNLLDKDQRDTFVKGITSQSKTEQRNAWQLIEGIEKLQVDEIFEKSSAKKPDAAAANHKATEVLGDITVHFDNDFISANINEGKAVLTNVFQKEGFMSQEQLQKLTDQQRELFAEELRERGLTASKEDIKAALEAAAKAGKEGGSQ